MFHSVPCAISFAAAVSVFAIDLLAHRIEGCRGYRGRLHCPRPDAVPSAWNTCADLPYELSAMLTPKTNLIDEPLATTNRLLCPGLVHKACSPPLLHIFRNRLDHPGYSVLGCFERLLGQAREDDGRRIHRIALICEAHISLNRYATDTAKAIGRATEVG